MNKTCYFTNFSFKKKELKNLIHALASLNLRFQAFKHSCIHAFTHFSIVALISDFRFKISDLRSGLPNEIFDEIGALHASNNERSNGSASR